MKDSTIKDKILFSVSGVAILFIFWIVLSHVKDNNFIYPNLGTIFQEFLNLFKDSDLLIGTLFTLIRVIITLSISLVISLIITFLYVVLKDSIYFFKPLIFLLKATPLAVVSLYLLMALGSDNAPCMITFMMIFPVTVEGCITAVDNLDEKYTNQIKLEGHSKIVKFFKIYLPLIFPYIIMTILQTFGMGIKVMVMAEYLCQTSTSLGLEVYFLYQLIDCAPLIAILIFIVLLTAIFELIFKLITSKLIRIN